MTGRWPEFTADHSAAIDRVRDSGVYAEGPECRALEVEFSEWLGVEHSVVVSNGTAAVMLALQALDLPVGTDVAVPAHTFSGSVWGVQWLGLKPRFLDVDPRSFLAPAVDGPQVVVHLSSTAELGSGPVVEDCAQAYGAEAAGLGLAAWSMNHNKTLWAGEGGIVTTPDAEVADRVRALRRFAEPPGTHNGLSAEPRAFNHKLGEFDAALARASLLHVDRWISQARSAANQMTALLDGHPLFTAPPEDWGSGWHKYRVRTAPGRDLQEVMAQVRALGVPCYQWQTAVLPDHPAFATDGDWPVARELMLSSFCLGGEKLPPCVWTSAEVREWADRLWKVQT
jgi:dTDP-4-amino-4,6-dideoxygalactose transaminase